MIKRNKRKQNTKQRISTEYIYFFNLLEEMCLMSITLNDCLFYCMIDFNYNQVRNK